MIRDLDLPMRVVVCPTVRDGDGLAMSSRNQYLNEKNRVTAGKIYLSLCNAIEVIKKGERSANIIKRNIKSDL